MLDSVIQAPECPLCLSPSLMRTFGMYAQLSYAPRRDWEHYTNIELCSWSGFVLQHGEQEMKIWHNIEQQKPLIMTRPCFALNYIFVYNCGSWTTPWRTGTAAGDSPQCAWTTCDRITQNVCADLLGQPCTLPTEALGVWVRFCQDMEGGQRMSYSMLREKWIEELKTIQSQKISLTLDQLPSLTDLELALRRVRQGRASGPDGIPGELCRHHASSIAKLLYPQMVKMMAHGHEPLGYKGGQLTLAVKVIAVSHTEPSLWAIILGKPYTERSARSMQNFLDVPTTNNICRQCSLGWGTNSPARPQLRASECLEEKLIYTYTFTYTYIYIYICIHIYWFIYLFTYLLIYLLFVYKHIYIYIYICMYIS